MSQESGSNKHLGFHLFSFFASLINVNPLWQGSLNRLPQINDRRESRYSESISSRFTSGDVDTIRTLHKRPSTPNVSFSDFPRSSHDGIPRFSSHGGTRRSDSIPASDRSDSDSLS
jgi:hypothetical protein